MKLPAFVIPITGLLIAVGAYSFGRHQGARSGGNQESPRTMPNAYSQSMLGPGSRNTGSRSGESGVEAALAGNLGGRALIDALLANQKAVPGEHMSLAILKAAEEPDPVKGNLMFAQLLQMLTPENAEAALAALAELPRSSATDNQRRLFRFAWGQIDGPAAAGYVSDLTGRNANYAAYSVMSGWASADPEAALAWTESIEGEGSREHYYRGIIGGLAKTDPDYATSIALERHAAGDREADDYISSIAREQIRRGVDVATAWIDTLTVTEFKQDAVYRVARDLVSQKPEEAAAWVERYIGDDFAVSAIGEVADEWAEEDGPAAVAWVAGLPPGDARTRAYQETFNEWTEDDPFAAAEHLVTMPNGADRDAAANALSRRHVRDDPEAAVTWAASITDEAIRNSALTYTGQQWMRRDPESAEAWLAASGLPEDVQKKIQAFQQSGRNFEIRFDGDMQSVGGFRNRNGSGGVIDIRGTRGGLIIRE